MADRFTLLTDFDGVWTEPARELQAVMDHLRRQFARLADWPLEQAEEAMQGFRSAVLAEPDRHGWRLDGRLSSYVDEDVFALPTSIGQWVDAAPDAPAAQLRAAILREFPSVSAMLDDCYHATCARFRAEVPHDLAVGAERVLEWLVRHQVAVVFASNAPLEKVQGWFACHGLSVADARTTDPGAAPLRAYGRAGKQWLSDTPVELDCAGRRVSADRPAYVEILVRERPDLVVGDVLSLDLAAPMHLRANRRAGAPRAIALMHLPHTPAWALEGVGANPASVDRVLPHVTALPRLIAELRAPPRAEAGFPRSG